MTTPAIGQTVTDFAIAATSDQTFRLSDFRDKANIVLYVLPKGQHTRLHD